MAVALGMMSGGLMGLKNRKKMKINCVASSTSHWSSSTLSAGLVDKFRTLRIEPGASENEVKKAFRRLALQYHPDVCKGSNCGVQFHRINEAYDVVMSYLRGESIDGMGFYDPDNDESSNIVVDDDDMRGMCDPDWDLWEEWMGWEGAGIRDYSSHINPYI